MCYDSNASLKSLFFGILGSALLYSTLPELAIYILFIYIMQIFDYIFWINPYKNDINYYCTKLAMISNLLQPIVWALCIVYIGKKKLLSIEKILLIIYIITIILYSVYHWNSVNYTLVTKESYPGLYWEWTSNEKIGINFWVSLYIIIIGLLSYNHIIFPYNFGIIILLISSFIISYNNYHRASSTGRMWCKNIPYAYFISGLFIFMFSLVKKSR